MKYTKEQLDNDTSIGDCRVINVESSSRTPGSREKSAIHRYRCYLAGNLVGGFDVIYLPGPKGEIMVHIYANSTRGSTSACFYRVSCLEKFKIEEAKRYARMAIMKNILEK